MIALENSILLLFLAGLVLGHGNFFTPSGDTSDGHLMATPPSP